jgi:hypothetical protein
MQDIIKLESRKSKAKSQKQAMKFPFIEVLKNGKKARFFELSANLTYDL